MKIFNQILSLVALTSVVWLSACDSSETEEATPEVGNMIPIPACNVTKSTTEDENRTSVTTFTYSTSGYPSSQTYVSTYESPSGSITEGWIDQYEFEGDKVVKVIEKDLDNIINAEIVISWEADKIEKLILEYEEDGETNIEEARYEYADDNLVKITYWDNQNSTEMVQYGQDLLTWNNGNVVKLEYQDFDVSASGRLASRNKQLKGASRTRTNAVTESSTTEYKYDDKNNPFPFIGYVEIFSPEWMGANNAIEKSTTRVNSGQESTYTRTSIYTYNEQGFPITETHSWGGSETVITNEYSCK